MENGKRPGSELHQYGIQGKRSPWHKSLSPTTEQQIATISSHSLRTLLWSKCIEIMEPSPTTSEQLNCSRTLQGIACYFFGEVS